MNRFWWTAGPLALAAAAAVCVAAFNGDTANAQQPSGSQGIKAEQCLVVLKDFATLAADRPGILEFVEPKEGDTVREGEVIAKLKDKVIQATLKKEVKRASNDISVQYAMKAAEVAHAAHQMATDANLKVPGAVPQAELDKLKLEAEKFDLSTVNAQLEMEVADLQVEETRATLDTYKVEAPFDGHVAKVHRNKGEAVRQGDPIIEVISTRQLKIEGFVTIAESYRIKRGDRIQVRMKTEDLNLPQFKTQTFPGTVVFVDPRGSGLTGLVKVIGEVDNVRDILKPGLPTEMTIMPRPAAQTARVAR
ncbi:MAG: efflux RND transporter periplasmic adaptor subunit [Planctomycetota bacterium]|jgi:membrane fusion protein (multidrug efflux system)